MSRRTVDDPSDRTQRLGSGAGAGSIQPRSGFAGVWRGGVSLAGVGFAGVAFIGGRSVVMVVWNVMVAT